MLDNYDCLENDETAPQKWRWNGYSIEGFTEEKGWELWDDYKPCEAAELLKKLGIPQELEE